MLEFSGVWLLMFHSSVAGQFKWFDLKHHLMCFHSLSATQRLFCFIGFYFLYMTAEPTLLKGAAGTAC